MQNINLNLDYLQEEKVKVMAHPPYSPDLASSGFWLFNRLKRSLDTYPVSTKIQQSFKPNRLILHRATPDATGTYRLTVSNPHGQDRQELKIEVKLTRGGRNRGQQVGAPPINLKQEYYEIGNGESINITPNIYKVHGGNLTWSKDGSATLPDGVTAHGNGTLYIQGRSDNVAGQYTLNAVNQYGRTPKSIHVRWKGTN
ncbi:unnamed protein product [Rotaria sp. Silwood1]|nr:unnamed protein product [Rotaria sp. Silwood1]CAF1645715.1 unnamed protein product [Rotaria sp. Silwood1]